MHNTSNTEEFERCVICGALTCIPVAMPIDWRENYEIGVGQVCAECAKKTINISMQKGTVLPDLHGKPAYQKRQLPE